MFKFILKGSIGTIDVLELQGVLSEKTAGDAREKMFERVKQGITDIVLLCAGVTQIDSSGVSLLIEVADALQPKSGKLHLVSCPPAVIVPMKSLGMMFFFQFYKTDQEAFQTLKITPEQLQELAKTPSVQTANQMKKQVAVKDHVRNKMILYKHSETSLVQDIVIYLQATYAHFRDKQLDLYLQNKRIPPTITLSQLFNEYGYGAKDMLEIREVAWEGKNQQPEVVKDAVEIVKENAKPSKDGVKSVKDSAKSAKDTAKPAKDGGEAGQFIEMMRRGGKLFNEAVIAILVLKGCLDKELAKSVKEVAELNQEPISTTLIEGNYVTLSLLLQSMSEFLKCESSDLENFDIKGADKLLPKDKAVQHCVLPIRQEGQRLWIAMCNPFDENGICTLRKLTGAEIMPVLSTEPMIRQKIEKAYAEPIPEKSAAVVRDAVKEQLANLAGTAEISPFGDDQINSGYMAVINVVEPTAPPAEKVEKVVVHEHSLQKTLPELLSGVFDSLHGLEQTLTVFQKLYSDLYLQKSSDEIYDFVLEAAFSLMPVECAIVLLFPKGANNFVIHQVKKTGKHKGDNAADLKKEPIKEKKREPVRDSSIENIILSPLVAQARKSQNLASAQASGSSQWHIGLPMVSSGQPYGILYLLAPDNYKSYDMQIPKMFALFLRSVTLMIENEALKARIEELGSRKPM